MWLKETPDSEVSTRRNICEPTIYVFIYFEMISDVQEKQTELVNPWLTDQQQVLMTDEVTSQENKPNSLCLQRLKSSDLTNKVNI